MSREVIFSLPHKCSNGVEITLDNCRLTQSEVGVYYAGTGTIIGTSTVKLCLWKGYLSDSFHLVCNINWYREVLNEQVKLDSANVELVPYVVDDGVCVIALRVTLKHD